MRCPKALAALLVLGLVLTGCGDPLKGGGEGGTSGQIIVGSSDVGEDLVLAQIYAGTLRHAGARDVVVRPPVGGREVVVKALQDRSLTLVADYSGNLLRYFDQNSGATTPADVYASLKRVLPPQFEVLGQAPAQDTDQLVVTKRTAASGIRSISDLGPKCGQYVFGGPGQWPQRWQDKIGKIYGCEFRQLITTDTGGPVTVAALRSGQAQVVDLFSTDSRIKTNEFVPLVDDKHMFPAQNVVPLVARGSLTPSEVDALNRLSAALTTDKLASLDDQYTVQKRDPLDIADDFLRENNLI